jgi:hypothetical protein
VRPHPGEDDSEQIDRDLPLGGHLQDGRVVAHPERHPLGGISDRFQIHLGQVEVSSCELGPRRPRAATMADVSRILSKSEARRVLRRTGFGVDRIDEILAQLSDPIDLDEAEPVLARYGVTRENLIDAIA